MRDRKNNQRKRYIGDTGTAAATPFGRLLRIVGMVALAALLGFVVALGIRGLLYLTSLLTRLIWDVLPGESSPRWYPLLVCTLGGLAIGFWTVHFGGTARPLNEVLGSVKKTGGYRVESLRASVVSFVLPLALGGSVGPETGMVGLIAAGCTWVGDALKRAGLRVRAVTDVAISATFTALFGAPLAGLAAGAEVLPGTGPVPGDRDDNGHVPARDARTDAASPNPADYTFRPFVKCVLYVVAVAASLFGFWLFSHVVGASMGLPRFSKVELTLTDIPWVLPSLAAGCLLTWVFYASKRLTGDLAGRMSAHPVLKPVLAGLLLGTCGMVLPDVLFSGEEQAAELMGTWQATSAFVLLATALLKAAVTPWCLGMGWSGGDLFPCIFSGASCGYGLALLFGANPDLCVLTVAAAFLAGVTRKPWLTIGILLLCFPVSSAPWMVLAAFVGANLPLPKLLQSAKSVEKP